jgi:hypothetical protein
MFGYKMDIDGRKRYWGARAIFKGYSDKYNIDLLWDRQSVDGMSDPAIPEDEAFVLWINERALPWLREKVKELALSTNEAQDIVLQEFNYELRANTNGSCGYLYIGAAEHPVEELEPVKNTASGKDERVFQVAGKKFIWGVEHNPPLPGTRGDIPCNQRGAGKVVGYFDEPYKDDHNLLCLMVEFDEPADWLVSQTMDDRIKKDVKAFRLEAKRGTDPEHGIPSPKALKEWKKNFKLGPCIVWDGDFKIKEAA